MQIDYFKIVNELLIISLIFGQLSKSYKLSRRCYISPRKSNIEGGHIWGRGVVF